MVQKTMHEVSPCLVFPAFPFEPYPIQLEFMTAVYHAIEKRGVGIVESPTGTGKTLSLICSALQWLKDQQAVKSPANETKMNPLPYSFGTEEPDWIRNFSVGNEELKSKGSKQPIRKQKSSGKERGSRTARSFLGETDDWNSSASEKQEVIGSHLNHPVGSADDDDSFLLDDYQSEDEKPGLGLKRRSTNVGFSSSSEEEADEEADEEKPFKVYFCSRTHSQLSQFIGELQRTDFSSFFNVVSLGSRKTLCVNPDVKKIKSSARVNERCLELQKIKTSGKVVKDAQNNRKPAKEGKCPFLRKQSLQRRFKEELLGSAAKDIEDLVQLGTKLGTCPYYGSRRSLPSADLVVLPYQSLLHAPTRESLGLNLKDAVVIIDEAHNLVDTISNLHSCQLSIQQLWQVRFQLSEYLAKFRNRLAATNRRYIETILVLVRAFIQQVGEKHEGAASVNNVTKCSEGAVFGQSPKNCAEGKTKVLTINDFLFSLSIDNINIFKIRRYINESNIVNKVSSYGEKLLVEQMGTSSCLQHEVSAISAFHNFADFILALTNMDSDGRVLVTSPLGESEGSIKFTMLNAAKHFAEVIELARAVILAGGTLQPVTELRARLFPFLPESKLHMFSCGHIVPPESILPIAVGRGPSGKTFDFTLKSRGCPSMIDELGRFMSNICSVVPEGVVTFFPSFEYENQVFSSWKNSGVVASIEKKKTIFREPRNTSDVELILEEYKRSVKSGSMEEPNPVNSRKGGALLLCVVGGKMSEGINFSDSMGRCVVMVGLPYPSPGDPELVERMKYIDLMSVQEEGRRSDGPRSREYYENICMKAVNQSIGRAIRHRGDYAAILLVDGRYLASGPVAPASKLAGWIKERLVAVTGGYGEVHKLLHQFFRFNQNRPLDCTKVVSPCNNTSS